MSTQVRGFRCRVLRIEATTGVQGLEEAVHWEVSVVEEMASDFIRVLGHMTVAEGENWGQVLVLGELSLFRGCDIPSVSSFLKMHAGGFIEEMYVVARRALHTNAALLDASFMIPVEPPELRWPEGVPTETLPVEGDESKPVQ